MISLVSRFFESLTPLPEYQRKSEIEMEIKPLTYAEALKAKPDGRSKQEIYDGIVNKIKEDYKGEITDVEAHEAAKNLIGFVTEILEIHGQKPQGA